MGITQTINCFVNSEKLRRARPGSKSSNQWSSAKGAVAQTISNFFVDYPFIYSLKVALISKSVLNESKARIKKIKSKCKDCDFSHKLSLEDYLRQLCLKQ